MTKEVIVPNNVHKARGYSHAFKAGNIIYLAGQAPFDQEEQIVGKGDIVAQVDKTFENMKRVLEAAGATMANVVKLTWYLKNIEDMAKCGEILRKYFQRPYPAGTAIEINRLVHPDQLVEIDAIAVVE